MQRIDGADVVVAQPATDPTNLPGYFSEVVGGAETVVTADWCNQVQEEIVAAVLDADIVLDKTVNTQLRDAIRAKIHSDLTDTGIVTNTHTRVIIASATSRAVGAQSAVIASDGCIASGVDCIALGRYCEINDSLAIGGGVSGVPILLTGANQNVSWMIRSGTGEINAWKIQAGNPGAGTHTIELDGATGIIDAGGIVTVNGVTGQISSVSNYVTGDVGGVATATTIRTRSLRNQILAWGNVDVATLAVGVFHWNMTSPVTKLGAGDFTITLDVAVSVDSSVQATVIAGAPYFISASLTAPGTIRVRTWDIAGVATDIDFSVAVIGLAP